MKAKGRGEGISQREQIAAVLRDAGRALSGNEIGDHIVWSSAAPCACKGRCPAWSQSKSDHLGRPTYYEHVPGAVARFTKGLSGTSIARHLEALAKAGAVEKIKVDRRVTWRWAGAAPDMSAFEEALALG